MSVKIIFMLDALLTSIFSVYTFFLRDEQVALMTGLAIFIAGFPLCLWLSKFLVLRFTKSVLQSSGVKVNYKEAIMTLPKVNTVAMPMNRFLTNGEYFVTDLYPEGLSQSDLLAYAASVEQYANHAIGKVIYQTAVGRGLKVQQVVAFNEIPCRGVEGIIHDTPIRLGNPQWIKDQGVSVSASLLTKLDQLSLHGKTTLLFSIGNMARGIVALKDEINPDAKNFISVLRHNLIESILLTASNKRTAKNIAQNFNFEEIRTDLTPNDKAREIQILRGKGQHIAVIANEFHDLPMLFSADVSVLLNDGSMAPVHEDSDAKMDFEILTLDKFLTVREIAISAVKLIKINRLLSYLSILILVPCAMSMAMEYPPIQFHPFLSLSGMLLTALIVLVNSMRMLKLRRD